MWNSNINFFKFVIILFHDATFLFRITGFAQLAKEDKDMVLEVLGKGEATTTTS